MTAEVIETTGNLVVHHPRIPTTSNFITFDELLRQPGSAPTCAEMDALDMVSIEQEVTA